MTFTFTSTADPSQSAELVSAGMVMSLTLREDGSFTVSQSFPDWGSETTNGTWTADDDSLYVTETGSGTVGMAYALSGDQLTIERGGEDFDFDGDGTPESATLVIVMERDTGASDELASLAGTWTASEFLFTNPTNAEQTWDLVAWGGIFVIKVDAGGTFQLLNVWPDDEGPVEVQSGPLSATADSLTVVTPDGAMTLGYEVDAANTDRMTLSISAALFDWDGDGTDDPADLAIDLTRGTEPLLSDMVGLWHFSSGEAVDLEDPAAAIGFPPLVDEVIDVQAGGAFTHFRMAPYDSTVEDTGTLSVFGEALIVDPDDPMGETDAMQLEFTGSLLTVRTMDWFDYDQDGMDEPVLMETSFEPYSGPSVADISGPWAASSYTVDPQIDWSSRELVSEGATFTLKLDSAGDYEMIQTYPGREDHFSNGTLEAIGPVLRSTESSGHESFVYLDDWTGTVMDIINPYSYFDVDDDEWDDLVVETIQFETVTETHLDSLVGTWTAASMTFHDPYDYYASYDMITDGGTFTLTVEANASYTVQITQPGGAEEVNTGSLSIIGDMLKIYDDADMTYSAAQYSFLSNTQLQLIRNDESHDFDGDGYDDPAYMVLILNEQ
ncbi:MAG: hypothetical protein R6W82_10970 [bacterium]